MAEFSELVQALTWLVTNRIQQKIQYTHGLLGDGNGRVRVSTIPGSPEVDYVFVRPDRFSNRTFKVFNKRIEGQDGDPIIIGELPWEPDLVQVVDMDWAAYADVGWGDDVTTTNRHGISHQWRDGAPGIDTFNVYRRQFGDLKTYSTTSGTLSVGVSPYSLDLFGQQYQWPGTQSFSLAGAIPTATGTARMALVYWSPASGTTQGFLGVATGTLGSGAEATILNRPVSPQGVIPSAFVRLAGGQSSISEFDIWDAREPFRPGLFFSTGSAGLSADMIPIADDSGLYTGSTVEAALDQIGFDGARVSKVYKSDFSAAAMEANVAGRMAINASVLATSRLKVLEDVFNTGQNIAIVAEVDIDNDTEVNYQASAVDATLRYRGSNADTNANGPRSFGANTFVYNTNTTLRVTGFFLDPRNLGAGTVSNMYGTRVKTAINSGGGTITNFFGHRVETQTAATFNYGFYQAGSGINVFEDTVGVGVTAPQGKIHSYDAISGFILWEYDGLDATVRTVVPNGAGDVLYRLTAMYVLRDSAAAVASGTTDVSNAASVNLTVGTNTVRLRVNADGSCDIARTAGSDTIKVALVLRWL
ncbi:MAG: hypothetical protein ACYS1A_15935 [Planctomycetota bacterium]